MHHRIAFQNIQNLQTDENQICIHSNSSSAFDVRIDSIRVSFFQRQNADTVRVRQIHIEGCHSIGESQLLQICLFAYLLITAYFHGLIVTSISVCCDRAQVNNTFEVH